MTANLLIPVAQYLRMSTERQQYSLENQAAAIHRYAGTHGYQICQTYADAARSGVVLNRRQGLRQLLQDVVRGGLPYRAILVYDVSRWGRFQDTDEAAHYEFLCKSAGVPVHYCAETFDNDGSVGSLLMKALKRSMAAEYSRELGVKILDGQRRGSRLGFKQGGAPGYGLRRMMVSADGLRKQALVSGERKSLITDRVVLVPGPTEEVEVVRDVYKMLLFDNMSVYAIARSLNQKGIQYIGFSKWDYLAVYNILTHPKYAGYQVFGQTSSRLYTPVVRLPKSEWILSSGAFAPIIPHTTFLAAQHLLLRRTISKSDEELLARIIREDIARAQSLVRSGL